jgi:transposase-like protein
VIDAHLNECRESGRPKRHNGKLAKKMKSDSGTFDLETPRDREGILNPRL